VTLVKQVVVEKEVAVNPIGESSAYLVIVGVILVSAALITAIICIVRRCGKKKAQVIVEAVKEQHRKEQDFDVITEGQYVPKGNAIDLLGVVQTSARGTSARMATAEG